jgi:hypothetical protein
VIKRFAHGALGGDRSAAFGLRALEELEEAFAQITGGMWKSENREALIDGFHADEDSSDERLEVG